MWAFYVERVLMLIQKYHSGHLPGERHLSVIAGLK
jgi:hypothetical protein